jgi:hypothetical protein
VRFTTAAALVNELVEAKQQLQLRRVLARGALLFGSSRRGRTGRPLQSSLPIRHQLADPLKRAYGRSSVNCTLMLWPQVP